MIQRRQSIYLLLAGILMILMIVWPLAYFFVGEDVYTYGLLGIDKMLAEEQNLVLPTASVPVLAGFIALISLLTIFLYKKRKLQMRLCIYNMILVVALYGVIGYYCYELIELLDAGFQIGVSMALPVLALAFTVLARRAIKADEALIKSYDRIR